MNAGKVIRLSATRAAVCAAMLALAMPTHAQSQAQETAAQRIERLEREINALQRAVFPGGDERFFEPEITAQTGTAVQPGAPQATTSALTDVLARLDAIEGQLARLTAASEVNENALAAIETRVLALEAGAQPAAPVVATTANNPPLTGTGANATGVITLPGDPPANPVATGPTPERLAGVQAVAKPATGDAGDDEYTYGFRLWDAGFYPEAQQQLALFVERYPSHWRTSYGRNLLGRAFLDAGDPRAAATHFLANYNADKAGARAPHSLLYLAESMIAIEDTRRACIALSVFGDEYAALAAGELAGQYGGLRGRVDCD